MMELYKFFHPVMSGASFVPSHNVFQEGKNIGLILSWWNLISEAIVVSKNAFSSASRYLGVLELSNETAVHRVKFLENSKTGNQSQRAKKNMLKFRGKNQVSNYNTFNYVNDIIQGCLLSTANTLFMK